jgi:exopolyphosphatase/pppGpp-phosphohydrolase
LGGTNIRIISGVQEAIYMGHAMVYEFADIFPVFSRSTHHHITRGFAAIGNGSLQTGYFRGTAIEAPVSIPYGLQTVLTECEGSLGKAHSVLLKSLKENEKKETRKIKLNDLYVAGGEWQDLFDLMPANALKGHLKGHLAKIDAQANDPIVLSFKEAKRLLTSVKNGKFVCPSGKTEHEIKVAAQTLLTVMEFYKAKNIIVSNATIRQGVALDPTFHTRKSKHSKKLAFSPKHSAPTKRAFQRRLKDRAPHTTPHAKNG